MKSVILMFVGGLVGGLIGPVTALVGVAAGYVVGRALTLSGVTGSLLRIKLPVGEPQYKPFPDPFGVTGDLEAAPDICPPEIGPAGLDFVAFVIAMSWTSWPHSGQYTVAVPSVTQSLIRSSTRPKWPPGNRLTLRVSKVEFASQIGRASLAAWALTF